MIIINSKTNNILIVKRSVAELNATGEWCIGGFETMKDIKDAPRDSEELTFHGITYRGLREEFTLEAGEIDKVFISSMSFVKHLGILVTALVKLSLGEHGKPTEGSLISRIKGGLGAYEMSDIMWLPLRSKDLIEFIKEGAGFYQDEINRAYPNTEQKWIIYTKLAMYEILTKQNCIGVCIR